MTFDRIAFAFAKAERHAARRRKNNVRKRNVEHEARQNLLMRTVYIGQALMLLGLCFGLLVELTHSIHVKFASFALTYEKASLGVPDWYIFNIFIFTSVIIGGLVSQGALEFHNHFHEKYLEATHDN